MKNSAILREPVQAKQALEAAYAQCKGWLGAGGAPLRLKIEPATRSLQANARLHAILKDVAEQALWMGRKRDVDYWRALMVSGWMVAHEGVMPELAEGLEGERFILRESTATMSGARLAGVMAYAEAWAVSNGVVLHAPEEWK